MTRNLEQEIKNYVLDNEQFFGKLGQSMVLSEKSLGYSKNRKTRKTIADLLILSENRGVIGVEVKTEYDNLNRLKRQMEGYSLVCDEVWVVCHDKHVDEVIKRLKRYDYRYVGIISYTEFKGKIIGGVYHRAENNPNMSPFHTLNTLLWKRDVKNILQGVQYPNRITSRELGFKNYEHKSKNRPSTFREPMKKNQLINNMLARFGKKESIRLLVNYYLTGGNTEKILNIRHFNPKALREEE